MDITKSTLNKLLSIMAVSLLLSACGPEAPVVPQVPEPEERTADYTLTYEGRDGTGNHPVIYSTTVTLTTVPIKPEELDGKKLGFKVPQNEYFSSVLGFKYNQQTHWGGLITYKFDFATGIAIQAEFVRPSDLEDPRFAPEQFDGEALISGMSEFVFDDLGRILLADGTRMTKVKTNDTEVMMFVGERLVGIDEYSAWPFTEPYAVEPEAELMEFFEVTKPPFKMLDPDELNLQSQSVDNNKFTVYHYNAYTYDGPYPIYHPNTVTVTPDTSNDKLELRVFSGSYAYKALMEYMKVLDRPVFDGGCGGDDYASTCVDLRSEIQGLHYSANSIEISATNIAGDIQTVTLPPDSSLFFVAVKGVNDSGDSHFSLEIQ